MAGSPITDRMDERNTVSTIEKALTELREKYERQDWLLDEVKIDELDEELEQLQALAEELPSFLHGRLEGVAGGAKSQYRTLITSMWTTTICAGLISLVLVRVSW